jgi:hypothetical protein
MYFGMGLPWGSLPPRIVVSMVRWAIVSLGRNRFWHGLFQSITGFPDYWFTFHAYSATQIEVTRETGCTESGISRWLVVPPMEKRAEKVP